MRTSHRDFAPFTVYLSSLDRFEKVLVGSLQIFAETPHDILRLCKFLQRPRMTFCVSAIFCWYLVFMWLQPPRNLKRFCLLICPPQPPATTTKKICCIPTAYCHPHTNISSACQFSPIWFISLFFYTNISRPIIFLPEQDTLGLLTMGGAPMYKGPHICGYMAMVASIHVLW